MNRLKLAKVTADFFDVYYVDYLAVAVFNKQVQIHSFLSQMQGGVDSSSAVSTK